MELGRGIFVIGLVFTALLLLLWRELFLMINRVPEFSARTLILGDSPMGQSLMRELALRPELGMRVVGQLDTLGSEQERSAQPSNDDRTERLLHSVKYVRTRSYRCSVGRTKGVFAGRHPASVKKRGNIHSRQRRII